jgi:hypothetical protein
VPPFDAHDMVFTGLPRACRGPVTLSPPFLATGVNGGLQRGFFSKIWGFQVWLLGIGDFRASFLSVYLLLLTR